MMMVSSVLDILIYVFDHYMLDEGPEVPEREDLARLLERQGFATSNVERALDWLTDLAFVRHRPQLAGTATTRIFSDCELTRLTPGCRGLLLMLERYGVLSAQQREVVIERLLALDCEELGAEQLKWVVLMVLSSQPGQEHAFARLEEFSAAIRPSLAH
jgi:Smg protein